MSSGQSVRSHAVSPQTLRPTIVLAGTCTVVGNARARKPGTGCRSSPAIKIACNMLVRRPGGRCPPGPAPSSSENDLPHAAGELELAVGAGKRTLEEGVAVCRALIA